MPLIGDLITRVRGIANDPCQPIGQPYAPNIIQNFQAGQFTGVIYIIITFLTTWGESQGSSEVASPALTPNTSMIVNGLVVPYAATAMRVYFGFASGQEYQYVQYAVTPQTTQVIVGLTTDVIVSATPPYKSSAWLPDTDGDLVDVSTFYRWINAGLVQIGRLAGGILDQTGAAPAAGTAEFVIPGFWLKLTHYWYNGWLLLPQTQSYTWLQSPVQGIPGMVTIWKNSAQQVLGIWPQGNTDPAVTTLTSPVAVGDNLIHVASNVGFTAPGMCQIDNEVLSYSQNSATQITGIVRGYGGTLAATHATGATVTQLIFRFMGRRMPAPVTVGMAAQPLDLPQGWDSVLDFYLLSQFKQQQNQSQEAQALMQQFEAKANELRDDQLPVEVRQVGGLMGGSTEQLAEWNDSVLVN